MIGVTQGTVQKYEKGECLPRDEVLNKIADYGKVTVEWLLHGGASQPEAAEIPEIPESIIIESPPPGAGAGIHDPYLFTGIDIDALSQIIESVEQLLTKRRKPLPPKKKALLISLLYDEFQKIGRIPGQIALKDFLRRVD